MKLVKSGRPTKFNETLEMIALNLAEKGHTDKEIAEIIGVSESSLNEHKKRKPAFHESLKRVKAEFDDSIVQQALLKRAVGMTTKEIQTRSVDGKQTKVVIERELPPDSTSLIFWLRNRKANEWNVEKQNLSVGIDNYQNWSIEDVKKILENDPFLLEVR